MTLRKFPRARVVYAIASSASCFFFSNSCKSRHFNNSAQNKGASENRNLALEDILPPTGSFQIKSLSGINAGKLIESSKDKYGMLNVTKETELGTVRLWATNTSEILVPNQQGAIQKLSRELLPALSAALGTNLEKLKPQSRREYTIARSTSIESANKSGLSDADGGKLGTITVAPYIYAPFQWPPAPEDNSTDSKRVFRFSCP